SALGGPAHCTLAGTSRSRIRARQPLAPPIGYIPIGDEKLTRARKRNGGARRKAYNGAGYGLCPFLCCEGPHVVPRLDLPRDCGPEGGRPGRRPAALGALLQPAGRPGPQEAPVRTPPRRRRGGRGPERLPQLLPRRGPGPLPPTRRPRQ